MADTPPLQTFDEDILSILRCPVTGSRLRTEGEFLVSEVGGLRYRVRDGIPVLLAEEVILPAGCASLEAFKQQYQGQIKTRS